MSHHVGTAVRRDFARRLTLPPRARLAGGVLLAVAALAAIAAVVDLAQVRGALASAANEPSAIGAALLAYTAAFWLRALAWRQLLPSSAPGVSAGGLFSILQAGLVLNHLLPPPAGEVSRPLLLARRGVALSAAVTTSALARGLDVLALLLIAIAANGARAWPSVLPPAVTAGVATLALVGAGAALVLGRRNSARVLEALPERLRARAAELLEAWRGIRRFDVALAAVLAGVCWCLEAGMVLAAAELLHLDLSLREAIGVTAFTVLAQVVRITPGGLGLYEASMTGILVLHGMPAADALALAVLTHGLKFAYALALAPLLALPAAVSMLRGRATAAPRGASRLEIVAARLWNVLNEGKPFTPTFSLGIVLLLSAPYVADGGYWGRALLALLAIVPLAVVCWRFDFPLRLRAALWVALLAFVVLFGYVSVPAAALVLVLYLGFSVVLWGTVYYHLRIGTPWSNFLRFWRLVLENPDPTSGNFLEQVPKLLLLVFAFGYLEGATSWRAVAGIEAFTAALAFAALLIHQRWFTWVPALPQRGYASLKAAPERTSRRVIVIAIDGCRADRLREARTPLLDRLRAQGTEFTNVSTVYPARTVTAFASMLTGAPPEVHGLRSNFVPRLGVRCESVFDVLRREGMRGVFVGIAHLIDAFGERDVRTVTAVMNNDDIDAALIARAQRVLEEEDPELLVLQLLSVDQTGHARGSYHAEYLAKIEETDAHIERFLAWCDARRYLEGATVLITSDHGQGIGIGGHGHMSPPEITVPCIWWGAGVEAGRASADRRFITEVAPTLCALLGVPAPAATVGRALLPLRDPVAEAERPLVFIVPAHNEAENLPAVLEGIARAAIPRTVAVVVDDGSTDGTARVAEAHGATVVRHEHNRGLGAALRTGLAVARDLEPRAAVYLDADGEYNPADARALLAPIERGEADYVLGSRFRGRVVGMTPARHVANACFSALLSMLCGRWISDGQTGMRAFSRRALEVAEVVHNYNYAQVLTLDLLHKGMRLAEVPVRYERRRRGRSFVTAEYLWRVPLGIAREMLRP